MSNQDGVHPALHEVVERHLQTDFQRPIASRSVKTFAEVAAQVDALGLPLVLDSGCGTGASSYLLADKHSEHCVIGIDKSHLRLLKTKSVESSPRVILARCDIVDFWRLAVDASWKLTHHYLLYPNPWPKKEHLKRRWHGHPVFSAILRLGGMIHLRSNWRIYVEEFAQAIECSGSQRPAVQQLELTNTLSPFENKYFVSGHDLYGLESQLVQI